MEILKICKSASGIACKQKVICYSHLLKYSSAITMNFSDCICVHIPCTTPAARGRRTQYSPGGPAASLAAACCSVSPWQRDRTLGFLDNNSDYSTSQAAFHTCQSEIKTQEVSNNLTDRKMTFCDKCEVKHSWSANSSMSQQIKK